MKDSKVNIQNFFKALSFEEENHKYSVDGKRLKNSVSGVVKKFVKNTDFYMISLNIDKSKGLPSGTTKKLWKNKADVAIAIGNKAHYFAEVWAFHKNIEIQDKYQMAVVKFFADMPSHYIPMFTELEMYHKLYMFGGTADLILFNTKTGKFVIADYKTNENLFKNYKDKTLRFPFESYLENAMNKYQIQFSLYQILLEQVPNVEVERRLLIWLKPDGEYELYDTQDFTSVLRKYMKNNFLK